MALILDGKKVRDTIVIKLTQEVKRLRRPPSLAIIQLGGHEDSSAYIRQKIKLADRIGAHVLHFTFAETIPQKTLAETINGLNGDEDVDGIIVQLPLPKYFDEGRTIDLISPLKDVDGLTAANLKLLLENKPEGFVPATARGVITLLDTYDIPVAGSRVVVVGRSFSVGKPIAHALLNRNATVTIAHSHSVNLGEITRQSDIIVVAAGKKGLIGPNEVRPGQTVIDVGINTTIGQEDGAVLSGDADFEALKDIVGAISPVPGGVGPMTVVSLFQNLVKAAAGK